MADGRAHENPCDGSDRTANLSSFSAAPGRLNSTCGPSDAYKKLYGKQLWRIGGVAKRQFAGALDGQDRNVHGLSASCDVAGSRFTPMCDGVTR
jgi:hypothetical protein